MSYKYDPITRMLVKTKDEDRSKLNSVLLKDMRKPKEHNPLDYRTRLQKLGYRPEVINKEMRSYSDGTSYADLKETRDSLLSDVRSLVTKNYPNANVKVSSFTSGSTTGQTVEITNLHPDQVDKVKNFIKYSANKNKFRIVGNISSGRDFVTAMLSSATKDSKTVDAYSSDVSKAFASLEKDIQRELKNYEAAIQKADTLKKCKELIDILDDLESDYVDEYVEIQRQVMSYVEKMKAQTEQLFGKLKNKAYKKSVELEKADK